MPSEQFGWSDEKVEGFVGNLLRIGVLSAAAVVALGGLLYLAHYGSETIAPRELQGAPTDLRDVSGIAKAVLSFRARGLIQLGLLLLIATPVARVVFSVFAFARQRDWTYVVITLIVLGVLTFSLVLGGAEGGR